MVTPQEIRLALSIHTQLPHKCKSFVGVSICTKGCVTQSNIPCGRHLFAFRPQPSFRVAAECWTLNPSTIDVCAHQFEALLHAPVLASLKFSMPEIYNFLHRGCLSLRAGYPAIYVASSSQPMTLGLGYEIPVGLVRSGLWLHYRNA